MSTLYNCVYIDSVVCVGNFVKNKFAKTVQTDLYDLMSWERYIVYWVVSLIVPPPFTYLFVVPFNLNFVASIPIIRGTVHLWRQRMLLFCRYTLAKCVIKGMNYLHKGIIPIKNYNIFYCANVLKEIDIYNRLFKNFAYISFLQYLRASESTYVYYKAIKLSQYYQTGYLFAQYSVNEAVGIVNDMIHKKDWRRVGDVQTLNALVTLLYNKVFYRDSNQLKVQLMNFLMIWNLFFICHRLPLIAVVFGSVVFVGVWKNSFTTLVRSIIFTVCCAVGENIFVSCLYIAFTPVFVYLGRELIFFVPNVSAIENISKSCDVGEYEIIY